MDYAEYDDTDAVRRRRDLGKTSATFGSGKTSCAVHCGLPPFRYYASQPISRSELQPGDLVFFYEGIGHVGIYIGGGQFIHASDYGVVVASLYTSYWSACYYGAGRILAN